MINIIEVNNTIAELENSDTTFSNCQKLAYLYIVRDNYNKAPVTVVEHELSDILPQYKRYCEIKRRYQLNEVTENAVINSIDGVCKEIVEFIQTLYGSTDMPEERQALKSMVGTISSVIK